LLAALFRSNDWARPRGFVLGSRPLEARGRSPRKHNWRLRAGSDEMTVSELASQLRQQGLQTDAKRADAKAGQMLADLIEHLASSKEEASQPKSSANGPTLLAELRVYDSAAAEADYFDEATGLWDLEGLSSDLALAKAQAKKGISKADTTREEAILNEKLFAELKSLEPSVRQEDYYEPASGWDVEGLQDDLRLAKAASSEAAPVVEPAKPKEVYGARTAEQLFSELSALDSSVQEEDYMSTDGIWDIEGLEDDLRLAKAASSGQKLFDELKSVDPEASKEDYYDAAGDFWDVEGLEDDLRLAKAAASAPATASATPAAPSAAAAPANQAASSAQKLFDELKSVDPEASKEDYYDAAGDFWDIEGLEDDLRLAKAAASAPATASATPAAPSAAAAPANQ
ncbi:unnamed protein product, partial [Symbiodinium microadriaticum]